MPWILLLLLCWVVTPAWALGPISGTGSAPEIDCPDVGGNHTNWNLATRTWQCGTSSSGGVPGNAKADSLTKGIATFSAEFIDNGSGLISLASTFTGKTFGTTTTVTLKDTLFTLQDDAAPTKQLRFQLQGITAGQTRTLTVPDLTDTLVTRASVDTLSNKELLNPIISSPTGLSRTDVGLGNVDNTSNAQERVTTRTLTNASLSGADNTFSNIPSAAITFTDTTLGDASLSAHGYMRKFPGGSTLFLNADNQFVAPPGSNPTVQCAEDGTHALNYTTALGWRCGLINAGTPGGGDFSSNTAVSIDGVAMVFSGTGGKTGRQATGTGFALLTAGVLSAAAQNSTGLRTALSDPTGTGSAVFADAPSLNNPLVSGTARIPTVIGGTTASAALVLQSTSGVGSSDTIVTKVGNAGAITATTIDTAGNLGVGGSPSTRLHVFGASVEVRVAGLGTQQTLTQSFYDNNTTLEGRLLYAGGGGASNRYLGLVNDGGDYLLLASTSATPVRLATSNVTRLQVGATGVLDYGIAGATNPAWTVDPTAASAETGLKLTATAAGSPVVLAVQSSATNEGLDLNTKGTGDVTLMRGSTGHVLVGGNSPRTLGLTRHTTANTAGVPLTVGGGGATVGATDKDGGQVILKPGLSTGTGRSSIAVQCARPAASSGTSDNALIDCLILGGSKRLADNVATAIVSLTLASNSNVSVDITYGIDVRDAANVQQNEGGHVLCQAVNVGGVVSQNTCTKVGNVQAISNFPSSTLSVVWDITTAGMVRLTVDSSLTPQAGYPFLSLPLVVNLGSQAMAVQ